MELSRVGNEFSAVAFEMLKSGGVGYLGTAVFSNLNPMLGFVFGLTYGASGAVLDPVFNTSNSTLSSQLVGTAMKMAIASFVALKTFNIAFTLGTATALSFSAVVIPALIVAGITTIVFATAFVLKSMFNTKLM